MDDTFEGNEDLLRGVLPSGMYIKEDGTLTSAAFKDRRGGTSVDRCGSRTIQEAYFFAKTHLLKGDIYCVTVSDCWDTSAVVKYLPDDDPIIGINNYHSEIHRNELKDKLTDGQAKHIANCAKLMQLGDTYKSENSFTVTYQL